MKITKILSLLVVITLCQSTIAQKWTARAGVNESMFVKQNITDIEDKGPYTATDIQSHLPNVGYNVGITVDFPIGSKIAIRTGALFMYQGTNFKRYYSADYHSSNNWWVSYNFNKVRAYSVNIPLLVSIQLHSGKLRKYLLIGGEFNTCLFGSVQRDDVSLSQNFVSIQIKNPRGLSVGKESYQDLTRFNYAVTGGFGFEYNRFQFEAIFSHTLNYVVNQDASSLDSFFGSYHKTWRQANLGLTVGYIMNYNRFRPKNIEVQ